MLARKHVVPEKLVTVDILQAAPRLLSTMPEEVSARALRRLDRLGINVILNRGVTEEDAHGVYLKDIQLNAKTIIWTAGVRPSSIYEKITGLSFDKGGRVLVDEYLKALNTKNVFTIGDSASTPASGTAQTATHDGKYISACLEKIIQGKIAPKYKTHSSAYVVPIGRRWAVFTFGKTVLSGEIFWWLRQIIDLRFLCTILPFPKALTAWHAGGILSETCPTCQKAIEDSTERTLSFKH